MNETLFKALILAIGLAFCGVFFVVVIPPLIEHPDVMGAFAAGFVNPYATGYSIDVILCWFALAIWVVHEASTYGVCHGWLCLLLGLVPGVAVGFCLYLIIRSNQLKQSSA